MLDVERRELRRGTQLIALGPQVFDLLVYLISNHDRVVSKDELLDAVWGGRTCPCRHWEATFMQCVMRSVIAAKSNV
jgi:DNA-binding response OmpR family regulator